MANRLRGPQHYRRTTISSPELQWLSSARVSVEWVRVGLELRHGLVVLTSQRMAMDCLALRSLARVTLTVVNGGEAVAGPFFRV